MSKLTPENKAELLKVRDSLVSTIENCTRVVATKGVLVNTNFIVGRDGLYLSKLGLDENKRTTGEHAVTCDPSQAVTFTARDAKTVAANIRNGNGFFEVLSRRDTCESEIERSSRLLATFDENWKNVA